MKEYWLVTWEQDREGGSYPRMTEAYDQHPADFLARWNADKDTFREWFPLILIAAVPITKDQYTALNK